MISSGGLPKFWYCFSLADRKKHTRGAEMNFEAVKKPYGKAIIKFQSEKPSVMQTEHDCTKSQGQESIEKETTWESTYFLAPSSGYKN